VHVARSVPLNTLTGFAAVALGGACGACARYGVYLLFQGAAGRFPFGTLLANLSGAFLAGVLVTLMQAKGADNTAGYLLLVTGFLGGFTTLSAFSVDTLKLLQAGATVPAAMNVLVTIIGALLAVSFGAWVARLAL